MDDPNPGTLTVKANGFAYSTDDEAASLGGNWIINILGAIGSYGTVGNHGAIAVGVGTPELATLSSVTVGAEGDIFGVGYGILTFSRTNVVNKGSIASTNGPAILEGTTATGTYKIVNSGTISSLTDNGVQLQGAGVHTIVNSGTIFAERLAHYAILGQTSSFVGIEKVTNSGTLNGDVDLGLGDDVFTNFAKVGKKVKYGIVHGLIDLGDGNDSFNGGKQGETVTDGPGSDIYKLGAGNDLFSATPISGVSGDDIVDGGPGNDSYFVSSASPVLINLNTVAILGAPPRQAVSSEIGTDKVIGFENAVGGGGDDRIYGSAGANALNGLGGGDILLGLDGDDRLVGEAGVDNLEGGTGNDTLDGGLDADSLGGSAGNDNLDGGDGNDFLYGGTGKDWLEGGADGDTFAFISTKESGVGATKRDVIIDFDQSESDVILLSPIDAATNIPGDQEFHLVGNGGLDAFTPVGIPHLAGELRYKYVGGSTIVEGDVNGDAKADFQIELKGHYVLTTADFNL